jgi:RNA polymerase sigma-70 factor (ECF subfamily)
MCVTEMDTKGTPLTRTTSLIPINDEADTDAWQEFVRFYGPVIYGFARKRGLRDADAADLMREVLRSVVLAPEHDPKHRTFRSWLFTVTLNKIGNFLSNQKKRGTVNISVRSLPDRALEPDWNTECERQLTVQAMNRVKQEFHSSVWQAFWKAAVEGQPAQDVGLELKMTPGTVHVAKSQVLARLNEEVQRLRSEAEPW